MHGPSHFPITQVYFIPRHIVGERKGKKKGRRGEKAGGEDGGKGFCKHPLVLSLPSEVPILEIQVISSLSVHKPKNSMEPKEESSPRTWRTACEYYAFPRAVVLNPHAVTL